MGEGRCDGKSLLRLEDGESSAGEEKEKEQSFGRRRKGRGRKRKIHFDLVGLKGLVNRGADGRRSYEAEDAPAS